MPAHRWLVTPWLVIQGFPIPCVQIMCVPTLGLPIMGLPLIRAATGGRPYEQFIQFPLGGIVQDIFPYAVHF